LGVICYYFVITTLGEPEIKTLGYPKAALFGFCVAIVSYNILSVVLAACSTSLWK